MNALVINCSPVKTGATAEIVGIVCESLSRRYQTKSICIGDHRLEFCRGCRSCHNTAECVIRGDDMPKIMNEFESADVIVFVSPSYWADVPGQFKAFIDRCTPWCDTHEPHSSLTEGKKGFALVLRTGPGMKECERLISTIEHFCGHMHIGFSGALGLCNISCREDVDPRTDEILDFCEKILSV